MHERVVEVLVFLMEKLRLHDRLGDIPVGTLAKRGYTDAEISTAFAWLHDRLDLRSGERRMPQQVGSIRMFHEVEVSVFGHEGYGYVLQCFQLGLLTSEDVEIVIERVMMSGLAEVELNDIKRVIATVLFETDRPADGGYPALGPTDSIH